MGVFEGITRIARVALASTLISSCDDRGSLEKSSLPSSDRDTTVAVDASKKKEPAPIYPRSLKTWTAQNDTTFDACVVKLAECPGDEERIRVFNGVHRDSQLPKGTVLRAPEKGFALPDMDRDPNFDPFPIVVKMQAGQTLWEYSQKFSVPLDLLVAMNCAEGEREVKNLQVGREITIPMVQFMNPDSLGRRDICLEGLSFYRSDECERIASRLLKEDRGESVRRKHLSSAIQHLSPIERSIVVDLLAKAIETVSNKAVVNGDTTSHVAAIGKPYAEALRSAIGKYGIENPFRLAPLALLEVCNRRGVLEVGDRAAFGEKLAIVITPDGDANGAFSSANLITERAMESGISVLYFQVGTVSEALSAGRRVCAVAGREVDYLFLCGHGRRADSVFGPGLNLSYWSKVERAASEGSSKMDDLMLGSSSKSSIESLRELSGFVRPGGSVAFVSCYSGQGKERSSNLVCALSKAAGESGRIIRIFGCTHATNVASVDFAGSSLSIRYHDGETFELGSAVKPKSVPSATQGRKKKVK